MTSLQIKKALYKYFDSTNEKKPEAVHTILNGSASGNYKYSIEELAGIYARRDMYKNNKTVNLNTEEFIDFVRKAK